MKIKFVYIILCLFSFVLPEYYLHIVLFTFFLALYQFIIAFGREDSIIEFISVVGVIQWLITPLAAYTVFEKFPLMAVDCNHYFSIALPGTLLFVLGLEFVKFKVKPDFEWIKNKQKLFASLLFISVGLISFFVMDKGPVSFRNIFYNLFLLFFIGVNLLYIGSEKYRLLVALLFGGFLIYLSASSGMFGTLFIWIYLFFNIVFQKKNITIFKTVSLIIIGIILLLPVQLLKQEYRSEIWHTDNKEANIGFLIQLYWANLSDVESAFQPQNLIHYNQRLNQGALVSLTYDHVPNRQSFVHGETIKAAIKSSLIPRIFWKDKPLSGGGIIFPKFTGKKLGGKTSANISPLAEAYVNFGIYGSFIFMFFFGAF